jgi:hypothetical protein
VYTDILIYTLIYTYSYILICLYIHIYLFMYIPEIFPVKRICTLHSCEEIFTCMVNNIIQLCIHIHIYIYTYTYLFIPEIFPIKKDLCFALRQPPKTTQGKIWRQKNPLSFMYTYINDYTCSHIFISTYIYFEIDIYV